MQRKTGRVGLPGGPEGPPAHSRAHAHLVSAELAPVVRRFSQTGIQDFLTLTLTEQTGLLYVGAREALFAFAVEALELQGVVRGGGVGGTQAGDGRTPEASGGQAAPRESCRVCRVPLAECTGCFTVCGTSWVLLPWDRVGPKSSTEIRSQGVGTMHGHLFRQCL